jgi:hypothetical protein
MRCVSLPRALMMMIGVARHRACALADLQPVHAGQHHVQHQRIPRAVLLEQAQAGIAAGGMGDVVALIAQVHAQQVGDVGIVFNDQHAFGRHRQLGASGEAGCIVARDGRRYLTKN